jgi:hypothetical protein
MAPRAAKKKPVEKRIHWLVTEAKALAHHKSQFGILATWKEIQKVIYSPRILRPLPPFAKRIAKAFWDVEPVQVTHAIAHGDPAFFVAFQIRLTQIDCAMIDAGMTIADRAPVVRSHYLLEGFRQAAENNLVKNGGVWPPSTKASREASASAAEPPDEPPA